MWWNVAVQGIFPVKRFLANITFKRFISRMNNPAKKFHKMYQWTIFCELLLLTKLEGKIDEKMKKPNFLFFYKPIFFLLSPMWKIYLILIWKLFLHFKKKSYIFLLHLVLENLICHSVIGLVLIIFPYLHIAWIRILPKRPNFTAY